MSKTKAINILYYSLCFLLGFCVAHYFSVLEWQWWVIVIPSLIGISVLKWVIVR